MREKHTFNGLSSGTSIQPIRIKAHLYRAAEQYAMDTNHRLHDIINRAVEHYFEVVAEKRGEKYHPEKFKLYPKEVRGEKIY